MTGHLHFVTDTFTPRYWSLFLIIGHLFHILLLLFFSPDGAGCWRSFLVIGILLAPPLTEMVNALSFFSFCSADAADTSTAAAAQFDSFRTCLFQFSLFSKVALGLDGTRYVFYQFTWAFVGFPL